jgi:uncharacterized protein YutE (UPF0331/DUF86 family)
MTHDQIQHETPHASPEQLMRVEYALPKLRGMLASMPDVRLAYYQPREEEGMLALTGPDRSRVIIAFTRNVSGEHVKKRLIKIRRRFQSLLQDEVEFLDIAQLEYREACEIAFNAQPVYGSIEALERERLFRYHLFLEWNAGNKFTGAKQVQPPSLSLSFERPWGMTSVQRFLTPLYGGLKKIDDHVRELRRFAGMSFTEFSADHALKIKAETELMRAIQSAILITISVMHRKMRLYARDFRDLFLLMPAYGLASREQALELAKCADLRDRLMFQYDEVSAMEIYQFSFEAVEIMQRFKTFVLAWLFDHYYDVSGEIITRE